MILLYERVYIKIINTVLIVNCTEIKTKKERPVMLTDGSVKHGCYKQLVVTYDLRKYVRQVMVGCRWYGIEKSGIFGELFRAHTNQFSPSAVSSLQWGPQLRVMCGYCRCYQKFL